MSSLNGARIGYLEQRHPAGHRGSVSALIVPILRERGACVDVLPAEESTVRIDVALPWDAVVLKSGSAPALHIAAVAEAQGIGSLNSSDATRTTRDKLAANAILRLGGLAVPRTRLVWLGSGGTDPCELDYLQGGPWVIKSARSVHGTGLWFDPTRPLSTVASLLPEGPYLLMEHVEHDGDDLKVFVAGSWMAAIQRPFPATTLAEKLGRPATRAAGRRRRRMACGRVARTAVLRL